MAYLCKGLQNVQKPVSMVDHWTMEDIFDNLYQLCCGHIHNNGHQSLVFVHMLKRDHYIYNDLMMVINNEKARNLSCLQ